MDRFVCQGLVVSDGLGVLVSKYRAQCRLRSMASDKLQIPSSAAGRFW